MLVKWLSDVTQVLSDKRSRYKPIVQEFIPDKYTHNFLWLAWLLRGNPQNGW